jgi:bifunctional non-homologous end joining protein LigD
VPFERKKQPAIGTKGRYPGFIEPALASSIEKVQGGERWLHESSSMAIAKHRLLPA